MYLRSEDDVLLLIFASKSYLGRKNMLVVKKNTTQIDSQPPPDIQRPHWQNTPLMCHQIKKKKPPQAINHPAPFPFISLHQIT